MMGVYIKNIDKPKDGKEIWFDVWNETSLTSHGIIGIEDIIEIVECKDCKHYVREVCRLDPFWERYTEPNDFCSQGERRE